MALAATSDLYTDDDCAKLILPGISPALVDKERYNFYPLFAMSQANHWSTRIVRDQANKTLDLYLTRIRRYAATLPETVQPATGATAGTGATPRMGTPVPSEGLTWTGWAISSFTNKITTANGQMAAPSSTSNGVTSPETRSSSVPPTTSTSTSRPAISSRPSASTTPLVSSGLKPKPAISNPFASPPPEQENDDDDFDTSWGDTGDADGDDGWGADSTTAMTDPFAAPSSKPVASSKDPSALFDDKGEPDFSGWLSAQADAKKTKKALPKGLVKSSAAAASNTGAGLGGRPGMSAKVNSTGGVKKTLPLARPKVIKKEEKVEEDGDDDAWGDAW